MDDRPPAGHGYIYGVADEKGCLQVDPDEKPTMKGKPPDPASIICQFCGKSGAQVPILFAAQRPVRDPNTFASIAVVFICNECIRSLGQVLDQQPPDSRFLSI